MAYHHRLPIVSATAGPANDGALIGSINESLYLGVFSDVRVAANAYLYRFEHLSGTSYDVSEYAVSSVGAISGGGEAGFASLFGSTAGNVSSQDVTIIACDVRVHRIWVEVSQAGVHPGTLEIHDGTDFARQRTITSDSSNAFRNTGIHEIVLGDATEPASWSPGGTILGITARRWYRLRLAGVTAGQASAAPRVTRIWIVHDDADIGYLDLTASANGAVNVAPATASFFPANQSSTYYCSANPSIGENRYVHSAQAGNRTRVVEFLTSSGWVAGTVTDPSNDFTEVPSPVPEMFAVRWTAPAGWASTAPPFTLPVGATPITTGYWHRIRTTAITTSGPMTSVSVRTRVLQYGNANTAGVEVPQATTLRAVTIESIGSVSGTGTVTIHLVNLTTGASAPVSIPVASALPLNVDITDLSLPATHRYGLFHVSGAAILADVAMLIH